MTEEPHETSIAVWDIPSPVVMNRPFLVKVGVTCSAGCTLAARVIEVQDETGRSLASARLRDTSWRETRALYWAEVELPAPAVEGQRTWRVISGSDAASGADHSAASATFSFTTTRRPEHTVTITAIDSSAHAPVDRVELRLGAFRAATDEHGVEFLIELRSVPTAQEPYWM